MSQFLFAAVCGLAGVLGGSVFEGSAPGSPPVAGPELLDQAPLLQAPLQEVTVFSDRARVRRRAEVKLPGGVHSARFPDLPGAALPRTVRVTATGARVLRAESQVVERQRFTDSELEALLAELDRLEDGLVANGRERAAHQGELALLARLSPEPPVAEGERVGRPLPQIEPGTWGRVLDFADQRRSARRERLRSLQAERERLLGAAERVARELEERDLGALTTGRLQVVAVVEVPAGLPREVRLELEYFVPGAAWWPTYDLHFTPETHRLTMQTAGLVRQATGEDWEGAALALSTAIPGQDLALPSLLTWTLGEQRDFEPRARPLSTPAQAVRFAPPAPPGAPEAAPGRVGLAERAAQLRQRLGRLEQLRRAVTLEATRGIAEGAIAAQLDALEPPAPPPEEPAPMVQPREEKIRYERATALDFDEVAIDGDLAEPDGAYLMATRSTAEGEGSSGGFSIGSLFASAPEKPVPVQRRSLALDAPALPRPVFSDPTLPAVLAGGLDYVYGAALPVAVASSGERVRVPLRSDSFRIKTYYEATPSLSPTAYLKATVVNGGGVPILAGPVNIFVAGDFAGEGVLATTGPGGELLLPLGADEDIRLQRRLTSRTESTGVFTKDEVTTYTVVIEVGNHKPREVEVRVTDQVPASGNSAVSVELVDTRPTSAAGPDADGLMRWDLQIPAGETRKVELIYTITRPAGWELNQW